MKRNHSLLLVVFISAAMLAFTARASAAEGHFERNLTVSGETDLDVLTGAGNISITRGGSGAVHLVGKISTNHGSDGLSAEQKVQMIESNPPIEQNGNTIRIGHIQDERLRNASISYEITVPEQTRVRMQSGSGDEKIEGIAGPVRAGTGSGNLQVRNIATEVHADTGSGDIEMSDLRGGVRANTGSGNIHATGISGALTVDTGSGDVHVTQSSLTDVKLQTGSGNVQVDQAKGALTAMTGNGDIDIRGVQTASWKLQAGSGSVHVHLPSDAAFELHARSGSGNIHSEHQITMTGTMRRGELRGTVRGGGALLDVSTGSGSIEIE